MSEGAREERGEINEDGVRKRKGERANRRILKWGGGRYSMSRVNLRELMTCEVLIDAP